jgi:hypothetical protein
MAAFLVHSYLAETARRDQGVRIWIAGPPVIVADPGRSLHVGEPFQPGGQYSWTAPVPGPGGADLVLKVAFAFPRRGAGRGSGAAGLPGMATGRSGCMRRARPARHMRCCLKGADPAFHWVRCCPSPSSTRCWPGCWAGWAAPRPGHGRHGGLCSLSGRGRPQIWLRLPISRVFPPVAGEAAIAEWRDPGRKSRLVPRGGSRAKEATLPTNRPNQLGGSGPIARAIDAGLRRACRLGEAGAGVVDPARARGRASAQRGPGLFTHAAVSWPSAHPTGYRCCCSGGRDRGNCQMGYGNQAP